MTADLNPIQFTLFHARAQAHTREIAQIVQDSAKQQRSGLRTFIRYALRAWIELYNILFSLRVFGDLRNKLRRAAPKHAGLKINSFGHANT